MNRLRRAVPICREHSLRVNARVLGGRVERSNAGGG